jgi:hypothetical protein
MIKKTRPSWWIKPLKTNIHHGCLHCGGTDAVLEMNTRLYQAMGGWAITKDGDLFFMDDNCDRNWEDYKQLKDIERRARRDTNHDWRAIFHSPLRGATYQRHRGKWVLIKSDRGFA